MTQSADPMPDEVTFDLSEELVIYPGHISVGLIIGMFILGALGAALMYIGLLDNDWLPLGLGFGLALIGFGLAVLLIRKRARVSQNGAEPTVKLAPDGLHFYVGAKGRVPWAEVERLSYLTVKGTSMLLVHMSEKRLATLEKSKAFEKAQKLDRMIGITGMSLHQQQLEMPLEVVAELIHQYSMAHGGRPLAVDP